MHDNAQNRFGSSRWANARDIRKSGLRGLAPDGIYCGFSPYENSPLYIKGDYHTTIVGGAGCGKGTGIIMQNTLGYGWQGSSLIVDPKGELAAVSMMNLHTQGRRAYIVNPYGLHVQEPHFLPKHKLKPLSFLNPASISFSADIKMVMEMLIRINAGAREDYFEIRARQWCEAIAKFLGLALGYVDILDFYRLICLIKSDFERFRLIAETEIIPLGVEDISRTVSEIIYERNHSERTFSSIIGTIFKNLGWLDDPAIQETFSGADFSFDVLTEENANIYIVLPAEYMGIYSSFLRLLIGGAMICKQRKPHAKRVLFLIDEAGQLGYFEMQERAYTYGRGAGVKILSAFQNIGQMNVYPSGAQTILGSSALRVFMGTRDLQTARLVSDMVGNETLEYANPRAQAEARQAHMTTLIQAFETANDPFASALKATHHKKNSVRKDKIQRPLITPDEVLGLPDDRMILLSAGLNCPPILARKPPYYRLKALTGRYMPNPYHPPGDTITVPGRFFGTTKKRVISERVPEHLRHYPQFQKGYWSRIA